MSRIKITKEKNRKQPKTGYEAPSFKDILLVFLATLLLILFSWIAYFKFGWLH